MTNQVVQKRRSNKQFVVCKATDLSPGERKIVELDGKRIGVFNVQGQFYALLNYCPHNGGALCQGPVTGTALPTDDYEFVYGYEDALIRCGWHGWEFEIATGQCLIDPKMKARTYQVTVENGGDVVVHI